jgi:hypothetical protein
MFTPETARHNEQSTEDAKARDLARKRETALVHAVDLAKTGASRYGAQGYTAEALLGYADKLYKFLIDGTVPTNGEVTQD